MVATALVPMGGLMVSGPSSLSVAVSAAGMG